MKTRLFGAILMLPLVGCIPESYISGEAEQVVELAITTAGGDDANGANVTFVRDFRGSFTNPDLPNDDASYIGRGYEGEGVTDDMGQVSLTFPTVTVCHFSFPINLTTCPDPLEDNVTGVPYLFAIELDGETEYFGLPVVAGDEIEGEMFSLTIVSVGDATPRDSDDELDEESN